MIEHLTSHPHPITYIPDMLDNAVLSLLPDAPIILLTDNHVAPLIKTFHRLLASSGRRVSLIAFPAGEKHKSMTTFIRLQRQLMKLCSLPHSLLLGIGGGVVTDMAGFLASTCCRGLPLILVPTTLMAMIDASIGGKNGINFTVKNRIGTFYLPHNVWISPTWLKSLPLPEKSQGVAEAIKHGALFPKLWNYLRKGLTLFLDPDQWIKENCLAKANIVSRDLKNKGIRNWLNFGHTLGHAIEITTGMPHGSAVSIGMLLEARCAEKMGLLKDISLLEELQTMASLFNLPTTLLLSSREKSKLLRALKYDKKNLSEHPYVLMMEGPGIPLDVTPVPFSIITALL